MSKIYLFLPDFQALAKSTAMVVESSGFNHSVFYYENEEKIYFYKPIGSFVYCLNIFKVPEEVKGDIGGLTQEKIDSLKDEFKAIEVPQMLCVSHIETTTIGMVKQ